MEKQYTSMYDRVFKEVFLSEAGKNILKKVLETCLKEEVKSITILNQELNSRNIHSRRKFVDAYIQTEKGFYDVEVNAEPRNYLHARNLGYLCTIYANGIFQGEEYTEEVEYVQINFTYHLNHREEAYHEYRLLNEKGEEFVKNFRIYEFNMAYYMDLWYNKDEKGIEENKYIIMMGLEEKELEKLSKNDEVVKEYMKTVKEIVVTCGIHDWISEEEDRRKIMNSEKKLSKMEGIQEGKKEGIKEGEAKAKKEIAKSLLEKNIPIDIIMNTTGLSKEEIEVLC